MSYARVQYSILDGASEISSRIDNTQSVQSHRNARFQSLESRLQRASILQKSTLSVMPSIRSKRTPETTLSHAGIITSSYLIGLANRPLFSTP